jgi:hypothetical protein
MLYTNDEKGKRISKMNVKRKDIQYLSPNSTNCGTALAEMVGKT